MTELFTMTHITPEFFARLLVHALTLLVVVRFIYFPAYKNRDFAFSYLMFSSMVFLITFFLKSAEISLGFTFGLFAVFAILRYRTETISTKEMTFLFIVIGLAMLNAVSTLTTVELVLINLVILALTFAAQSQLFLSAAKQKLVQYERIELIQRGREAELLADLSERSGLDVTRAEVLSIDLVRDTASLKVFYTEPDITAANSKEDIQTVGKIENVKKTA